MAAFRARGRCRTVAGAAVLLVGLFTAGAAFAPGGADDGDGPAAAVASDTQQRLLAARTVLAAKESGFALPRTAVVRMPNGGSAVWDHVSAERFVPQPYPRVSPGLSRRPVEECIGAFWPGSFLIEVLKKHDGAGQLAAFVLQQFRTAHGEYGDCGD